MSEQAASARSGAEPGDVVVEGSAKGFAQGIAVGGHRLVADEPVSAGGTATGPGPYNLLLAALGSCTSMTVALYARRKSGHSSRCVCDSRTRRSTPPIARAARPRRGRSTESSARSSLWGPSTRSSVDSFSTSPTNAPCIERSPPRSRFGRAWHRPTWGETQRVLMHRSCRARATRRMNSPSER